MTVSRRKELFPNVSDTQWNDWKWQVKNRIETLEDLQVFRQATAELEAAGNDPEQAGWLRWDDVKRMTMATWKDS